MTKNQYFLLLLCFFFVILKLSSIITTSFNLYGDEAQYWLWSKNLDFGYFSKPPLLAWFIRLVSLLAGDSFFVLKSIPVILYCFTSFLVYLLAKKLWKNQTLAIYCALTFFLLPSVSLSSFLISTDILLIFFWTAGLIQVLNIKQNPTSLNYVLLGIIVGLAFLAKYAAIYFFISLAIYTIIDKKFRNVFLKSKINIFIFMVVVIIILMPNIIWNQQNGWLTIQHTAQNASLDSIKLSPKNLVEFLLSQIIMVGPVLFFGFVYFYKNNMKIISNEKFLISFSLPILIIVSLESLLVRAHANWAAVSLVSFTILFIYLIHKYSVKIININNYINLLVGVLLFIVIGSSAPIGAFDRIKGIKDLVQIINKTNKNQLENIVVSDRMIFANLSYEFFLNKKKLYSPYAPGSIIGNHFQITSPLPVDFSENFIFIGNINEIKYLNKKINIKNLSSVFLPFSKNKINFYEVSFN